MAMEIYVFSDRKLESLAQWQAAIEAEGFALRVATATPFEALSGFLPMDLDGRKAGCECDHFDAAETMDSFSDVDFGRRWRHALAFRWGGDMAACLCAYMAAAAYARATDGHVLDCDENRMLTPREAANVVRELQKFVR